MPGRRLVPWSVGVLGTAAVSLLLAGCSSGTSSAARQHTPPTATSTIPGTSTSNSTAPTTTTTATAGSSFPSVVVQAMAQFVPLPAGAEAPFRLPQVSGYLTAQTGGLGGMDNVTLITTSSPVPVNSPDLTSTGGTELAEFSTTPTASDANANSSLDQAKSQSIDSCGGPSQPMTVYGTQATSCPTIDGAAIDWTFDGWQVQVVTLSGTTASVAEADQLESTLSSWGVPTSNGAGIVSVVVPANPSVGKSDTAALEWVVGPEVYQARSNDNPGAAVQVAAAMRPYPGG